MNQGVIFTCFRHIDEYPAIFRHTLGQRSGFPHQADARGFLSPTLFEGRKLVCLNQCHLDNFIIAGFLDAAGICGPPLLRNQRFRIFFCMANKQICICFKKSYDTQDGAASGCAVGEIARPAEMRCFLPWFLAPFPYGNQFSPQQGHYVDPDPACGLAQENPADMGGG